MKREVPERVSELAGLSVELVGGLVDSSLPDVRPVLLPRRGMLQVAASRQVGHRVVKYKNVGAESGSR